MHTGFKNSGGISVTQPRIILIVEDDIARARVFVSLAQRVFVKASVKMVCTFMQAREILLGIDPDMHGVALVSVSNNVAEGLNFVGELALKYANFMPVVISDLEGEGHLLAALRAGAQGYMLKDEDSRDMEHALRQMLGGFAVVSPKLMSSMMRFLKNNKLSNGDEVSLSRRETEVLGLLGRGMRVRAVAVELGLSEHTVGDYVKAIYKKLNISSRAEAAVEAMRRGLVK